MSQSSTLYGRQYELTWLSTKLFPKQNSFGIPPLVLLHGPGGCGKTSLSRSVINLHAEGGGRTPLIVFSANAALGDLGLADFSQALIQTGETTKQAFQGEVTKLKSDFKLRINERTKDRVSSTEAYNLDGTAKTLPMSDTLIAGDPMGQDLAALSVELLQGMCEQIAQLDGEDKSEPRLLYIFDDFSDLAPAIKSWVGGPLLEEFSKADSLPAPGILVTDQDSWEAGGQKDYWQKNPGTFFQMEIPPMDHASCLEWLTDVGHSPALIDILMEDSEGIPPRVRELIETPGLLQEKADQMNESKDLAHSVTAKERRWLHAAAMADFVPEESLLLLLGMQEGQEALQWFRFSAPFDAISVPLMGGIAHIHMGADFREMILQQNKAKVPARHREFLEKIDLQARVAEKVPGASDRESLRMLAPIQPFNSKILKELFGNNG